MGSIRQYAIFGNMRFRLDGAKSDSFWWFVEVYWFRQRETPKMSFSSNYSSCDVELASGLWQIQSEGRNKIMEILAGGRVTYETS